MAKEFTKRGIEALVVHSGYKNDIVEDREQAIKQLEKGEIKVIFSVDMFNEGLDKILKKVGIAAQPMF